MEFTEESFSYMDVIYYREAYLQQVMFISNIVMLIIISISLPLNGAAIYATSCQEPKDNVARTYIINLLVSDLLQLWSLMAAVLLQNGLSSLFLSFYCFSLMVGLAFRVVIALERCSVVSCPQGSCFRQALKISVLVCSIAWLVPICVFIRVFFSFAPPMPQTIILFPIFLLLPCPFLIFSLGLSLKSLCASSGEPPGDKRRVVGSVFLLLLIYSLLFLPFAVFLLTGEFSLHSVAFYVLVVALQLSPLADVFLCCFLNKRTNQKLLASCCRRTTESNDTRSSAVNEERADSSV